LKQEIEIFLDGKKENNNEIMTLLRKKVETNEKEIFDLRNQLIEQDMRPEMSQNFIEKRRTVSPDMHTSVVTKKNIINLKNDLQNFKNEMRRSLSVNESGVRERFNSLSRSIKHIQTKNSPQK
jgi:rhamnose utilization protein RhaD (predicted bifunctional aldolase and dehydrogenase)